MAILFMMIGIPGCGKSTFAAELMDEYNAQVFSSDAIRGELYGNESVQSNPKAIFDVLHKRVRFAISHNQNVIYDATNINADRRKEFLNSLSEFEDLEKICAYFVETPETCISRQLNRDRKVPEEVIYRMFNNLQPPTYNEGWDSIFILYPNGETRTLDTDKKNWALLDYIVYNKNWKEELTGAPYHIEVKNDGDLYLFKYNQLDSNFSLKVVQESRGCILKIKDNIPYYVCRPFTKFFNFGEELAAKIDWATAKVTEKVDGSLMKMFYYEGEWKLATNGTINAFNANVMDLGISFGQIFERALGMPIKEFGKFLDKNYTYLFELTSPETRVVISYSDGVYFLARKENIYGVEDINFYKDYLPPIIKYPKQFNLQTLEDVVNASSILTKDEEGFVVNDIYGNRIKVKSPEYLIAAKCIGNHNLSNGTLFGMILEGKEDDLLAYAPEYTERVEKIKNAIHQAIETMENEWNKIKDTSAQISQKEFADLVKGNKYSDFLFKKRRFEDKTASQYFNEIRAQDSKWKLIEEYVERG